MVAGWSNILESPLFLGVVWLAMREKLFISTSVLFFFLVGVEPDSLSPAELRRFRS